MSRVASDLRELRVAMRQGSGESQQEQLEALRRRAGALSREALALDAADACQVLAHGAKLFVVDAKVRAVMLNNHACCEKRRGDLASAVLLLEDAVDCEGGEELCPCSTLLNLSAVVLQLEAFPQAVRVAQMAVRRIVESLPPREELLPPPQQPAGAASVASASPASAQQQQQQQQPQNKEKVQQQQRAGLLLLLSTARYNLGVALREMGDRVKGRKELEKAYDILIENPDVFGTTSLALNDGSSPVTRLSALREQSGTSTGVEGGRLPDAAAPPAAPVCVDPQQIARLRSAIEAALALPIHEGGMSPPSVGNKGRGGEAAAHAGALVPADHGGSSPATTPQVRGGAKTPSSSKFSRIRGLRSPGIAGTPVRQSPSASTGARASWDNTTSIEANLLNRHQRPRGAGSATTPAAAVAAGALAVLDDPLPLLLGDARGAAGGSGGGDLVASALSPAADPSVELRLAGTYVPIRLVRLTEEVRFRESCRRIALARARADDLTDLRLLMQRERLAAFEEQERVELEVEHERLLGVMCYWIEFKTALLFRSSALGAEESAARGAVVAAYQRMASVTWGGQAQALSFQCEQDTERGALLAQEQDAFDAIARHFAEREAYFVAKAELSLTQVRALACALSAWAIDNALCGENTVHMLRPEMQQSPIVLLRSLTFGQGKWSKTVRNHSSHG